MDFYISMAVAVLLEALKDKTRKPKVRAAAFKVFRTIAEVYSDDQTFVQWARMHFAEVEPK